MTHADLVKLAVRWLRSRQQCPVVISELTTASRETPDAIGFKGICSWLVECKTSRADFKADWEKHFRRNAISAMGRWRYYIAPVGLIERHELPKGWGLLEVHDNRIYETIAADYQDDTK